jgi:peptidyl-dipeptidase A
LDAGEEMRYAYEESDFENQVAEAWKALQPLYKELFTYVRRKLLQLYGPNVIRPEGPLPGHLLGNLWAQDWSKIIDLVAPYPEYKSMDVTDEMLRQGFTPLR